FFTNNSSGTDTIFDTLPKLGQTYCFIFYQKVIDFLGADKIHTVKIAWTSSHTGI
ncbi:hypothetical protein J3R30DRAFT_3295356, partial [Lentinula aciculospora]